MDHNPASTFNNPYASPAPVPEPEVVQAEVAAPQQGSFPLILLGVFLLVVGHMGSNVLAMLELYPPGAGPGGQSHSTPLAEVLTSPFQCWLLYAVTAAVAVAGAVLVGSQNHNPMAAVCYVMCPIAALAFLAGMPLRWASRLAVPVATIYLAVGTCLAGAGVMQLYHLFGRQDLALEPMLASMLAQMGVALLIGGLLKLWRSGAFSSPNAAAVPGGVTAAHP